MHPNGDLESTRVHEHTSTRASDLQSCVRITAPVAYLSSRPAMCICGVRRMKVSCRDHSRYSIISHHHHHELYRMLSLARTHRQQIEDGARAVLANVRARVSRRLVQQERHTTHQVRIDIRRRARSGRGSRWRSRPRTWCRGTAAALLARGCSTVDTSATALVVARPACSGRRHSDEAP